MTQRTSLTAPLRRLAPAVAVGLAAYALIGSPKQAEAQVQAAARPAQLDMMKSPKQRVPHRTALRELDYGALGDAKVTAGR